MLPHAPYLLDLQLAATDYSLFQSMQHRLLEPHFNSYEELKNCIDECLASKDERWYWGESTSSQKDGKVIDNDSQYFDSWIHSVRYLTRHILDFWMLSSDS